MIDLRHHKAARLLRCFAHDAAPPLEPRFACGAGVGRLDTRGVQGEESAGPQFGAFLQDLFESVRFYQRLHDRDGIGRLSAGEYWFTQRAFNGGAVDSIQSHRPFGPASIEHGHGIAGPQPQHDASLPGCAVGQDYPVPVDRVGRCVEPG